jgi:hypothetical protein
VATKAKVYDIDAHQYNGTIDAAFGRDARKGRVREAAERILRTYLGDEMAAVDWDGGMVAYYSTQDDADGDDDGSSALAVISPSEVD